MNTSPRRLGRYELQQRLGRGGMAEVWKALDTQLQRYVAIKLLHADLQVDPDFMRRFEREARMVASLYHPNIVQVHDFQLSHPPESDSTLAYMVMDYVEGQTLADYIHDTAAQGIYPPPTEIVHLFTALGGAIDYAHEQGMVHRDIKPANILLDTNFVAAPGIRTKMGEPILTDFGIVKLMHASTGSKSDSWISTPLYIAPEQVRGYPGSKASDIYSLGVILYEICTGRLPFQGNNPSTIMMQHMNERPPDPASINPHISAALSQVILRGLAKDPVTRFPSASALATALAEAFNLQISPMLITPTYANDILNTPTHSQPGVPVSVLNIAASSPSTPIAAVSGTSSLTPLLTAAQGLQVQQPLQTPPSIMKKRGKKGKLLFIAVLVALLVLGGGFLGTLLLHIYASPPTPTSQVAGFAFFVNSGQWNADSNSGIEDRLQLVLHNIPAPTTDKRYYAWLLGDRVENKPATKGVCTSVPMPTRSLFLGPLPVNQGNVVFTYGGTLNVNLLASYSRLLITEEDANKEPSNPSTNQQDRRYYAELPQAIDKVGKCFSALDDFRHLLVDGTKIQQIGIRGGLDVQLLRNVQKVLEWAYSAREAWRIQPDFIHRQITRILDYIDGEKYAVLDLPHGTPLLTDPRLTQVGLAAVSRIPSQRLGSYLALTEYQLRSIIQAPGVSTTTLKQITQADKALTNVQNWLFQVYKDAKLLFAMSSSQLAQATTLDILDDLETQANYAFAGRIDPSTDAQQAGTIQVHYDIQQLPTFTIQPYTAS